jgi:hypothetical protein
VHYNLCFGTVLAVGGPEQVAALDAIQDAGELGCFALTEKLAGVQSGLVVETEVNHKCSHSIRRSTTLDARNFGRHPWRRRDPSFELKNKQHLLS